jgi:hypothetical protein
MAEWSKDHMAAIGYLNLTLVSWIIVKLETERGPYVESADRRMEWFVESRHLQGSGPHLCRLRTDGLAPVSKY